MRMRERDAHLALPACCGKVLRRSLRGPFDYPPLVPYNSV